MVTDIKRYKPATCSASFVCTRQSSDELLSKAAKPPTRSWRTPLFEKAGWGKIHRLLKQYVWVFFCLGCSEMTVQFSSHWFLKKEKNWLHCVCCKGLALADISFYKYCGLVFTSGNADYIYQANRWTDFTKSVHHGHFPMIQGESCNLIRELQWWS